MRISVASIRTDRGPRRRSWQVGLLGPPVAMLAGCGHSDSLPATQVYEVKGKVLLADGKPLSGGWIYFVPKGDLPITPSGEIGSDGTFSLVTGGSGEGAPAGEYKVRIEAPQLQRAAPRSRKKPVIPGQVQRRGQLRPGRHGAGREQSTRADRAEVIGEMDRRREAPAIEDEGTENETIAVDCPDVGGGGPVRSRGGVRGRGRQECGHA